MAQYASDALKGTAGAVATDKVVQNPVRKVAKYLPGGSVGVDIGISFIGKLPTQKPTVFRSQCFGFGNHAATHSGGRCQNDLSAQIAH